MDPAFLAKAQKHWTADRVTKVTGGKKLLLQPDQAAWLLRVMGLLNNDASMSAHAVRKYRQINHMLALIKPDLELLCQNESKLNIIDMACGNSYMTLLLAWFFSKIHPHPVAILGIDHNSKVIAASKERARQLGFDTILQFHAGAITQGSWQSLYASYFPTADNETSNTPPKAPKLALLVALHACDTASDEALSFGVAVGAEYMAVAPCCQAELAQQWKSLKKSAGPLRPLFASPALRRTIAADTTDLFRMLLIKTQGYSVIANEFVASEHTLKNRILLCHKRQPPMPSLQRLAEEEYAALKKVYAGGTIKLETLLQETGS